jgi:hypothetical protein
MVLGAGHLLKAAPPWILGFAGDRPGLRDVERSLHPSGLTTRVLRGARTRTTAGLLSEFASRLEFPGYFGGTWDSLDECLADLSWLPSPAYTVAIDDARLLLESEPDSESRLRLFANLIEHIAAEWATPVSRGGAQDRPAVPFHLVLQESPQNYEVLVKRLTDSRIAVAQFEPQT